MLQPTKREGAGSPNAVARFEPVPGMVVAEKYRVESVLGEGGMGVVVAATHLGLEQPVAIKFLHPEAMGDKDSVERFLREAKVAAMIRSDYVARVHDVGSLEGGVPYIVMEHLEGTDLGDLISLQGPLPIEEACEVTLQACAALAEVHAAGIVHRDLKPSNLFITRRADGSPAVKLLDFGISKLSSGGDKGEDPALTATTTIMGSPSYMSPEQLKSTKEVDARTDLWSLGAVLYEAVTGKPAFRGENVPQVCAMIASEDPVAPSARREGVPPELEKAILGCLAKKPDERTTLVELARTLATLVPERARGLLDRIEATVDPVGLKPRPPAPSGAEAIKKDEARVATAVSARERRTGFAERDEESPAGKRRLLPLLLLVVGGVLAAALYTGRLRTPAITKREVSKEVSGASSAVASAASAMSAAASAVASAVASSLPDLPLPDPSPSGSASPAAPSASVASDEPSEPDEPDEPAPAPHGSAAQHAAHAGTKPAAPKPHAKPHHATKPWHRKH